jgi:SAM-dependent methyltransferase
MKTGRKKEWFDNTAFWRDFYPLMFPKSRFADTPKQLNQLLKLAKPSGKNVLDLCCGPGRFSIALAKRGYKVTGVDKTEFLLNKAKALAKSSSTKIEWIHQDMRDFIRPDSYNLALNMFTSFGFFVNKDDDMLVIQNVYDSLRKGGIFVIDIIGKERLAKIFVPSFVETNPDGTMIIRCHEVLDNWTRTHNQWILVKKNKVVKYSFNLTVYSGQELIDRLEWAGFSDIKLYGNLDGEPYGFGSERLIAVARKK